MAGVPVRVRGLLAASAVLALLTLVVPTAAVAHAYLVTSTPAAGSRLAAAPRVLTLSFSEPFVSGSERVTIRRYGGGQVALPRPRAGGSVIRQPLPHALRGIYIVSWRVLSDDGHLSLGEFAFAVGRGGKLPVLGRSAGASTPWSDVLLSWALFVGLALALGGVVAERFVLRQRAGTVGVGLALAALAAVGQLVTLAGNRAAGGFGQGLEPAALERVVGARPGALTLAVLGAVSLDALLRIRTRFASLAALPLFGALLATALRGHSATSGHGWAVAADFLHLSAAAVWVGALVPLAFLALRAAPSDRRRVLEAGVRRYARLALPTVAIILLSGFVTALAEFDTPSEVVNSDYGRALLVKAGIIAFALALAASARRWGLLPNPGLRLPLLRRLTATEAVSLLAVLAAVAVLVNLAPPRGSARPPPPALGPPPVAGGAVRLADLAGQLVVALTAADRELQLTLVPPAGRPDARLSAEEKRPDGTSVDLYPRPCGAGCYVIRLRRFPGETIVAAKVAASAWPGGTARFAVPWPVPPDASLLLRRVVRKMETVPQFVLQERVTSDSRRTPLASTYRLTGRGFLQTELYRAGAVDARVLARRRGTTELGFALPASQVWYRMWIDGRLRIRRERVVSRGHLIERTFEYRAAGP